MFAKVVIIREVSGNACLRRAQERAAESEPRDVFEDVGVLHSLCRVFTPCKRGVARHQHAGDGNRIEFTGAEAAYDYRAGVADVARSNLFGGERLSDRNRTVKVVGVRGA